MGGFQDRGAGGGEYPAEKWREVTRGELVGVFTPVKKM